MDDKLKPCPFCGSKADVSDGGYSGTRFWIHCVNNDCIAHEGVTRITREAAIAIWNRRVEK